MDKSKSKKTWDPMHDELVKALDLVEEIRDKKTELAGRGFRPAALRMSPAAYGLLACVRDFYGPCCAKLTRLIGMEIIVDTGMGRTLSWRIEEAEK